MDRSLDADLERAFHVLREGGLVLLRTDVGYGLVGLSDDAVRRIYELKGRPGTKPCITVANAEIFAEVARVPDERLRTWVLTTAEQTPLAVVTAVRPESKLLQNMTPFVRAQATTQGTVATFHSAGTFVTMLAEQARAEGKVLVGSSANVSSTGNNYELSEVPESIRSRVDLVVDHGPARYRNDQRLATTLLDLTTFEFLRKGINHERISTAWSAFLEEQTKLLAAGHRAVRAVPARRSAR